MAEAGKRTAEKDVQVANSQKRVFNDQLQIVEGQMKTEELERQRSRHHSKYLERFEEEERDKEDDIRCSRPFIAISLGSDLRFTCYGG